MADDEGFQTVGPKKLRQTNVNRSGFSSPAERLINASDMQVFMVPLGFGGLTRDNRPVILNKIKALPDERQVIPVAASRRTVVLLDAFASLLVSQREKEIIAVALSPRSEKKYIFWIAASGPNNRLNEAKKHMEEIWSILKGIRADIPPSKRRQTTPDETGVVSDPASDIFRSCYNYSRERLKKHFDKPRDKNMHTALQKAHDEAARYRLEDAQLAFVDKLIELFRLYEIYEAGNPDPIQAVENAYSMMRQCSEVNELRRKLPDRSVAFLETLLPQCGGVHSDGTLYGRLIDKMLTLDSSIERLLILSESGSMGSILDEDVTLEVRTVDDSFGTLHYNFAEDQLIKDAMHDDSPMAHANFLRRMETLTTPTGYSVIRKDQVRFPVHGECALLAHIDQAKIPTFNYFGVSKLCCIGCWLFFQAYNSLDLRPSVPRFFVRGTHSRQYPWVAPPSMPNRDATLRAMEPLAKAFFRELIPRNIRDRNLSENSSGSLTDHKVKKDWEGIFARGKKLPPVAPPVKK